MNKKNQTPAQTNPAAPAAPLSPALRILLVDDHAIVRDGLKQILASKFPQATFGKGCNALEALDRVGKESWDVLLLDISMPGQSGLDVLHQIKALQPELKVLVLTMHPEDQYAMRVLKAGASGYLTKETASAEVVNAVQTVRRGGKYISATLAQRLASNLNAPAQKAPHETLSDREYQVLRMIAAGRSVKEIGFDLSLSVKTVSTYRTRVLTKLGFKTSAEVIRYAMREKLVE
jgi:DNA-binding NarL/FixJ family response regulator